MRGGSVRFGRSEGIENMPDGANDIEMNYSAPRGTLCFEGLAALLMNAHQWEIMERTFGELIS
jgi:hypothetical protein